MCQRKNLGDGSTYSTGSLEHWLLMQLERRLEALEVRSVRQTQESRYGDWHASSLGRLLPPLKKHCCAQTRCELYAAREEMVKVPSAETSGMRSTSVTRLWI